MGEDGPQRFPDPQPFTFMAVVRVRGRDISLEPVGGLTIPPGSRLSGLLTFPLRPSDDGLVLPVRMWLCHVDDPRVPPRIDRETAAADLRQARRARLSEKG